MAMAIGTRTKTSLAPGVNRYSTFRIPVADGTLVAS